MRAIIRRCRFFISTVSLFSFGISHAGTVTVLVGSGGDFFSPSSTSLCQGDTVYFVWAGGLHNVHFTTPAEAPSPDLSAAGDTFLYVPLLPGNYIFQCDYHAPAMAGSLTVLSPPVVNLGADLTYCGDAYVLDATSQDASYLWSTGATTPTIAVTAPDTFYVEVTNACGMNSDTIIVFISPVPFINAGNDITICSGNSATLTATGGAGYVWISGLQTTASITVSPTNSTFYSVIGTSASGCTKMATVSVTVTYPAVLSTVSTPASCPADNDGILQVTTSGGALPFTYLWNTVPPQTSALATGLAPGSYSVSVTDAWGCSGSVSGSVAGSAASLATTFASSNRADGNMFDISALTTIEVSGFDGNLDDGGGTGGYMKIYYKTGSYAGYETDASAWTLIDSVFVNPAASGVPAPIPVPVNVVIPAGQTYAFYITGNNSGCEVKYSNGTSAGAVYAQDTNLLIKEGIGKSYPFSTSFSPRVWNGIVHYCAGAVVDVGEGNWQKDEEVSVFPNPTNGRLTLYRAHGTANEKLSMYNSLGEKVFEAVIRNQYETMNLQVPPGLYFYTVSGESKSAGRGKVIVE